MPKKKPKAEAPPEPVIDTVHSLLTQEEWQVLSEDKTDVFFEEKDVREYLRLQWANFVDSWKPNERCMLKVEVLHVIRHRHIRAYTADFKP